MKSRLTPEAELDLIQAIRWYDERARNWVTISCGVCIAASPPWNGVLGHSPLLMLQTRRALVRRFPFQILYDIENEEIIIYAVYHSARDPEVWKRRRDS